MGNDRLMEFHLRSFYLYTVLEAVPGTPKMEPPKKSRSHNIPSQLLPANYNTFLQIGINSRRLE